MKQKFPIPKRMILSGMMALVCLLLTFAMIVLSVHLTGNKSAADFTQTDEIIFVVAMAADAALLLLYIVFVFASARMSIMRTCLVQKRQERFGADGKKIIYSAQEDVHQDISGTKRALSYKRGKLILMLIEIYDDAKQGWKAEAMRFYDSLQEAEQSLREEYGFEWNEENSLPSVSVEDDESNAVHVSIEDSDF